MINIFEGMFDESSVICCGIFLLDSPVLGVPVYMSVLLTDFRIRLMKCTNHVLVGFNCDCILYVLNSYL
jgi:hypothetical protein